MIAAFYRMLISGVIAVLLSIPAIAQELPEPSGEVVLTVSGDIKATNRGDSAVFDIDMLKALGEVSFKTKTPWTEGEQTFAGVSLHALMERLGVTRGILEATAVNDYIIDIPVSDAVENGPILAYLQNGDPMSVRENGPLWVVYPYDQNEAYQAEVIFSRSIWQLASIEVDAEAESE